MSLGAGSDSDVSAGYRQELALGAAFLNAAFGFCLGCEMYLLGKRMLVRA